MIRSSTSDSWWRLTSTFIHSLGGIGNHIRGIGKCDTFDDSPGRWSFCRTREVRASKPVWKVRIVRVITDSKGRRGREGAFSRTDRFSSTVIYARRAPCGRGERDSGGRRPKMKPNEGAGTRCRRRNFRYGVVVRQSECRSGRVDEIICSTGRDVDA
jgi:hypothetical protein